MGLAGVASSAMMVIVEVDVTILLSVEVGVTASLSVIRMVEVGVTIILLVVATVDVEISSESSSKEYNTYVKLHDQMIILITF